MKAVIKKSLAVALASTLCASGAVPAKAQTMTSAADESQTVSVIVELEEDSLLEQYEEKQKNDSSLDVNEYLESKEAQKETDELLETQQEVVEEIQKTVDKEYDEASYQYTTVMNGFAMDVKTKDINKMKQVDGVKNVYIATTYEAPKESYSENDIEDMYSDGAYDGAGTVIAVLDTGIQTEHNLFNKEVESPKLSEKDVKNVLRRHKLNAFGGMYYNSSIPFVYDYADCDNDISPTYETSEMGLSHGTCVSSIVRRNAREAQILGMKVFSDETFSCNDAALIAALEDSVTLGADVINMSLGAPAGMPESDNYVEKKVYENVKKAGVELSVAAGNNGTTLEGNGLDGVGLAANPDISLMDEPASFAASTSVASSDHFGGMSDYTSWGMKPNLVLAPDLTAPGGNVYEALPFGEYEFESGTSFSAPAVAGNYAVIKACLNEDPRFKDLSNYEKGILATQLLMSTCKPLFTEQGVPYSPRQQGSGEADGYNAITTEAYLYNENEEYQKPKISFYDDAQKTGHFQTTFHIKNISDEEQAYQLNPVSLTQNVVKGIDGRYVFDGTEKDVSTQVKVHFQKNGIPMEDYNLTVAVGEDALITVDIQMSRDLTEYYDEYMENGGYLEGFVIFEHANGGCDLSMPYLGFYGDWCKAPIFENAWACQDDLYQTFCNTVISVQGDQAGILGMNPFETEKMNAINAMDNKYIAPEKWAKMPQLKNDISKIALSPNGDGYYDDTLLTVLGVLRNAKNLKVEVSVENGEPYQIYEKDTNVRKTLAFRGVREMTIMFVNATKVVDALWMAGEVPVNNQKVYFTFTADVCFDKHESEYKTQKITVPITIDLQEPEVIGFSRSENGGKTYLNINATDNQYVSNVEVIQKTTNVIEDEEMEETKVYDSALVNEQEAGASSIISLDITEALEEGISEDDLTVKLYDYAYNWVEYKVADLKGMELPKTEWNPNGHIKAYTQAY